MRPAWLCHSWCFLQPLRYSIPRGLLPMPPFRHGSVSKVMEPVREQLFTRGVLTSLFLAF